MNIMPCICPSLLAGDFGALRESALAAQAAGADELHMDIMDANFVPNLSMNSDVVAMAHSVLRVPLNVHLMMISPEHYLRQFVEAGARTLSVHIEARGDIAGMLRRIRALGAHPAVAVNPETPASALDGVLELVDEVLCMTVHPGFGGQKFMPEVLPKIAALHQRRLAADGRFFRLAVDGGIDRHTIGAVAAAGAEVIIAGSALYRAADMAAETGLLRAQVARAHAAPGDAAG